MLQSKLVDDYKVSVKEKIKQFSDFLGQKSWFTGDEVQTNLVIIPPRQADAWEN